MFATLASLDGGGTVNAANPSNWSLNELFTAGAWSITRPSDQLSVVDVRKWAMLDSKPDLSIDDNKKLESIIREKGNYA